MSRSDQPLAAFLERSGSVTLLLQHPAFAGAAIHVVADSWAAQAEARAAGLACTPVDELLDADTAAEANRTVLAFRRNWYRNAGGDFTVVRGISLGRLFEFELSYTVLFPLVRSVYAAVRRIGGHRPALLVTDVAPDTVVGRALAAVCRSQGVGCEWIGRSLGAPPLEPHYWLEAPGRSALASLRSRAGRLAARALSVVAAAPAGSKRPDRRILVYYYPSLGPILDAWVDQGLGPAMLFDPAAAPPAGTALRYLRAGARVLRVARGPEADARFPVTEIQQHWRRVRDDDRWWSGHAVCGADLRGIVGPVLDAYVADRLPHLAREIGALQSAFARDGVGCLVVPFDAPERPRMLASVAATCGIPTVVAQHGLVVSAHLDDDKSQADYVLTWSQSVRDQLVSWGHDPTRIHVVGNPMFDRYARGAAAPPLRAQDAPAMVLVMAATSMNFNVRKDSTISERYLRLVLDALGRLDPRPRVVLRPHPAERPGFYRSLLASWGEDVEEIAADRLFAECVAMADAVVSPVSTGALEAWLAGKPVVVVNDCAWGVDYPLDGTTEIPAVATPGALTAALAHALAAPGGAAAATRPSRLGEYCGALDGRSASRAVELIDRVRRGERPTAGGGG